MTGNAHPYSANTAWVRPIPWWAAYLGWAYLEGKQ